MGKTAGMKARKGVSTLKHAKGTPNGARRNTQARSAKQVTKRQKRLQNDRVAEALEKAREERERLDRIIEQQREKPAVGATAGALYVQERLPGGPEPEPDEPVDERFPERPEKDWLADAAHAAKLEVKNQHRVVSRFFASKYPPYESEPKPGWTVADALRLMEEGYSVARVMRTTGVGFRCLEHLPLGDDGRLVDGVA